MVLVGIMDTMQPGGSKRAEDAWRWLCRLAGAILLGLLVIQRGFLGPVGLYFLFAGLMTLGDVIAEAMRLRRDINEIRARDDDH